MDNINKLTAKQARRFYKRFANGEQYLELDAAKGIVTSEKDYYWQQQEVYNKVLPLLKTYGKDLTADQLYGKNGLVSLLYPWQKKYNTIMNAHDEHVALSAHGYMLVEDGSVDIDRLEEEGMAPGKILVYRQGSVPPVFEKPALNNMPYLEAANYCYQQMIDACEMFVGGVASKTGGFEPATKVLVRAL